MGKELTKLVEYTQKLICNKFISSVTGTIKDRTKRKHDKLGEDIFERLKRKEKLPDDSSLVLKLDYSTKPEQHARNLSMAIEEFKGEFREYGIKLQKLIDKHRSSRRAYLKFGLQEGTHLPDEVYIQVIKDIIRGITDEDAEKFYRSVIILDTALQKKKKPFETLLLPE